MTNYNDGNWHGWNGGECLVHPKSEVRMIWPSLTENRSPLDSTRTADGFSWSGMPCLFRVVKEYREPREFWIADIKGWKFSSEREAKTAFPGCTPIHVREVTK